MQEIERYGLITLLFLVVSAIAVALWDGTDADGDRVGVAAAQAQGSQTQASQLAALGDGSEADARAAAQRRRRESERLTQGAPVATPGGSAAAQRSTAGRVGDGDSSSAVRAQGGGATPLFDVDAEGLQDAQRGPGGTRRGDAGSNDGRRLDAAAGRGAVADLRAERARNGSVEPPASPLGSGLVERRGAASEATDAAGAGPRQVPMPADKTLSHLAQTHLGSASRWPDILAVNPGLDPNRIVAGTLITLPDADDSAPVPAPSERPTTQPREAVAESLPAAPIGGGPDVPANTRPYVVARGDSAWRIAERELGNGARYRELIPLNPGVNLDSLKEGTTLRLPAGAVAAASTTRRSGVR